ncbi:MAG: hypothetical protein JNL55_28270, partial [Steroidobacter sp.]|nr:hypothetical protein [Steroidobacter sp.]
MLVRRLGAGGSGEVWLAHDRERNGSVAVKILSPALTRDEAICAALRDECARVVALTHPNVLPVA